MKKWTIEQVGDTLVFTNNRTSETFVYTLNEIEEESPAAGILEWIKMMIGD